MLQDTGVVPGQLFAVINVLRFVTKNNLLEENSDKAAWSERPFGGIDESFCDISLRLQATQGCV